jgi:peptidoglycan/LPS O-acetylase OafA/YrhL
LLLFLAAPATGAGLFYDLAGIFIFFPFLLWICARWEVPKRFEPACGVLGDVSYPLYVLHYPLLQGLINIFVRRLGFEPVPASLAFAGLLFGFCWLVARHVDTPVRRWLSGRAHVRAMAAQPVS